MKLIKDINSTLFLDNVPVYWKTYFEIDSKKYSVLHNLKWFYIWNDLVWWIRKWENSNSFDEEWMRIICKLLDQWYTKLSYFFIVEKSRWNWYWADFLKSLIWIEWKYYLSCKSEKLVQYYEEIWFEKIHNYGESYLMTIWN